MRGRTVRRGCAIIVVKTGAWAESAEVEAFCFDASDFWERDEVLEYRGREAAGLSSTAAFALALRAAIGSACEEDADFSVLLAELAELADCFGWDCAAEDFTAGVLPPTFVGACWIGLLPGHRPRRNEPDPSQNGTR